MNNFLNKFFGIEQNGSTIRTEIIAGLTTFMTMAYIIIVNPQILSTTGMPAAAVMTATILASFVGTFLMGVYANLPFAQAPGMGINAFFAFTICGVMGHSWQFALTAVFIEGIIFILITLFKIREAIIDSIPNNIKLAISVGIGLFIALIGFLNAGVIVKGEGFVPLVLGDVKSATVQLCFIGLIITSVLLALNIKGALLIGIFATTLLGIPYGLTTVSEGFNPFSMPASISPIFMKFEFNNIFTKDMFFILMVLLFVDMFNTLGTFIGVCKRSNMLDKDGRLPRAKQALLSDAFATSFGAVFGTSTTTTYVESAAGVSVGGRTGFTSVITAICFLFALFLAPLFLLPPAAATAPALILVGVFMMQPVIEIDFEDYTESVPAFLTLAGIPFMYNIAHGIVMGLFSFVVLKLFTGRIKEVKKFTIAMVIIFAIKMLF